MNTRDTSSCIRSNIDRYRLVVDQQRIGRCVVGAPGFVVKTGRIMRGQLESAAVQNNVTSDDLHAHALQATQHQPQALQHQFGVALPLNVEIAAQYAIDHRAPQIHGRAPHIGRAELIERRIGGDQLHDGGRIHGLLGAPGQTGSRFAVHIHHQQGHGLARNLGALQRGFHSGGNPRIGGLDLAVRGLGQQRQQRCAKRGQGLAKKGGGQQHRASLRRALVAPAAR